MSREARAIFSLLLMAACAATVLADVPPSPSPTIPGPGFLPPGKQGDIEAECWSSLQGIPGCVREIYGSIFTGKLSLGPACCKAFQSLDANCLAKLLPPFFPPLPQ
ncbi:WW domain-binding protein 11-like [Prunus yedoensis var. nudiflora]|uniref:WW domain-binding protein 11-like n=1 Tax=Prunus yedoensis var. nudiflora TaxID=2094558 RepID=A0A314Y5R7_PRUYE|nr:WW domain-binding protein 11-like [Prunus yedoensis var. nudiflora]